jgi:hypothetical protein
MVAPMNHAMVRARSPERRGVAHMRDADHQRREHQRRDDHLDQPQEDVGDDREPARHAFSWALGSVIVC